MTTMSSSVNLAPFLTPTGGVPASASKKGKKGKKGQTPAAGATSANPFPYTMDFAGLLKSVDESQKSANAANQARLDKIMNYFDANEPMAELDKVGAASRADIRRQGASREALDMQDAVGRGLYNASYLDAARNRTREATDRSIAQLDENLAGQRAGILERRDAARAGVLERVMDQGPDQGAYLELITGSMRDASQATREQELYDKAAKERQKERDDEAAARKSELDALLEQIIAGRAPIMGADPNKPSGMANRPSVTVGNRTFSF